MEVINEITDHKNNVLAVAGTEVTIISKHSEILIVQDLKGNRFPVKSDNLRDDPEPVEEKSA